MPDYDNVDRLREIFGCSLSDILEPDMDELDEGKKSETSEEKSTSTNLPILVNIMQDKSEESERKKRKFSIFDFLSKNKIKALIEKMFGYEYANTYNEKFLFKGVFRRRSREDYENTLTQGMFRNKMNHNVIGIEAPWLYMKLFVFLLFCSIISLIPALLGLVMPLLVMGALVSVMPLLMFIFESNFSRNISIFDVLSMFTVGGLASVLLVMISQIDTGNEIVSTVLFAPIYEEFSKALITVVFVAIFKPKNMLTGLLIGFSVGAGFTLLEDLQYAFSTAVVASEAVGVEFANVSSVGTILVRSLTNFFSGHHYYTGIFGAIYVLFKGKPEFDMGELLNWRPLLALLYSIVLHSLWNASCCIEITALSLFIEFLVYVLSTASLIVLINIGISQTRIIGIFEDYRSEHRDA